MTEIVNFILTNYVWILVIVLIILLAIIGSVAEKSIFGAELRKTNEEDEKKQKYIELKNKKMSDLFESGAKEKSLGNESNITSYTSDNNTNYSMNNVEHAVQSENEVNDVNVEESKYEQKKLMTSLEDKLKNLDKEINEMLPQKNVVDDSFSDDLESLDLNLTQNLETKKDFNFESIELPQIKSSKISKKSIWQ